MENSILDNPPVVDETVSVDGVTYTVAYARELRHKYRCSSISKVAEEYGLSSNTAYQLIQYIRDKNKGLQVDG